MVDGDFHHKETAESFLDFLGQGGFIVRQVACTELAQRRHLLRLTSDYAGSAEDDDTSEVGGKLAWLYIVAVDYAERDLAVLFKQFNPLLSS